MKALVGGALVAHMEAEHGYVAWNPPKPNTRAYRQWKTQHEDAHVRWSDQFDHNHEPAA